MNRFAAIVVGALLLALIGGLVWKSGHPQPTAASPSSSVERDGGAAPPSLLEGGATALDEALALPSLRAGRPDAGAEESLDLRTERDPSSALPPGSPKTVRFGVILVQYRGAQGAPAGARSKEAALTFARTLAEEARTDFKAQVGRGDTGSLDDAGRIPRGVLEPPVELALFTLTRGAVSDPIDTPRGFWIVKRIE